MISNNDKVEELKSYKKVERDLTRSK